MNEPLFSSGGGQSAQGPFTWGGEGRRRVCDADGKPYPAGTYGDTVAAGYFMIRDDKFGTQQWVKAGEMVQWDGAPDPMREALIELRKATDRVARLAGLLA